MNSFNFNNLVEIRNPDQYSVIDEIPRTVSVPDLSGVFTDYPDFGKGSFPVPDFADYGIDFGTGGYIPEPGFTYGNVFGDAGGTGAKKSGGFLDTLIGSVGNLFGGGSLPADPYAGSEVSRSFGRPRSSSYVGNTQQRMNSLLANAIDSFKEPRSVI
jgi:hypothetical protein